MQHNGELAGELRHRAEKKIRPLSSQALDTLSPDEVWRLAHELQVHQIELEMQNEELRQARDALETARARYFQLYELAPVGYVTVDEPGTIQEANLRASILLGVPRKYLINRAFTNRVHPDDQDLFYFHRKQLLSSGETQACELRLVRGDGVFFWARLDSVLEANEGRPPFYRVTMCDISEHKIAEAEKKKLQDELCQSQKLESVGRLAGGVAHDFNNMLSVIIGYAEMTLDRINPMAPEFGYLEQILNATRRSADLTRQLLAFARKQQIRPRNLCLNEVVSNMLKLLRRLIGEDIELILAAGAGLWPVHIDPSQIDQIIANLCVNARDAMPNGGMITIETQNVVLAHSSSACHAGCNPGEHVMLTVSDTGCGIEAELIKSIFEPFFTTKEAGRGTGMGLATVYGIVRQNVGGIEVESKPGNGTTFRVYLPRARGTAKAVVEETITRQALPRGNGEMLLLVEDQPEVLCMGRRMLEQLGYNVLTAGKAEEALHLVETRHGKIDLIITDIVMPGMNGKALIDRVRAQVPGIRYLLMSGYAGEIIDSLPSMEENTPFIAKPFSLREIAEKIQEVLSRSSTSHVELGQPVGR